jgi:hypothetical protein
MMQAMPRILAIAALLLSVGTVTAFAVLLQRFVPIPPAWYLGGLSLAVVLALVAVMRARSRRWLPITALLVSGLLLGLAGYFNFVLARIPSAPIAVAVGQPAPDFTLPDAAGRPVRLADYRGKKPVVLVFYRGYW